MRTLLLIALLLVATMPVLAQVSPADSPAGQLIDQQEMRQLLNDYLAEQSDRLPQVELSLGSVVLPRAFRVPQGHIEHQLIPAKPGVLGSRRVTLLTRVDQQIVSNKSIRIELKALAEVVVAAADLRRGTTLTQNNVILQRQDISKLKQPIFNLQEVYGKQLKRSLRLGQSLMLVQVDFPPLIKRGERVEIQVQRGGLVLTAAGEARQDGQSGETIRVLNSGSRREVLCRVLAPGLVRVEF